MADKARRQAVVDAMARQRAEKGEVDFEAFSRLEGVIVGTLRTWLHRYGPPIETEMKRGETETESETGGTILPPTAAKREEDRDFLKGLNDRQAEALAFVMEGHTQAETARRMGVKTRTVETWASSPAWRVAREYIQRQRKEAHRDRLDALVPKALDTVVDVLDDAEAPASARSSTAFGVLDRTGFGVKSSLEVTGPDGFPLEVLHSLSEETLAALEAMPTALLAGYLAGAWPRWRQILIEAGEEFEDAEVIHDEKPPGGG